MPAAVDRISQLKLPGKLDFDSSSLATNWKQWKDEVELYMDLAMSGKDEKTKIKLFLYLIGCRDREIFETSSFTAELADQRLSCVLEGYEAHCNPKKNENHREICSFNDFKNQESHWKVYHRFKSPGEDM